jgi:hypothetical protein
MKKILALLVLTFAISSISFAETVKEVELKKSQNFINIFNKVCVELFSQDDESFNNFLIENNFEDLNENIDSRIKLFLETEDKLCSISIKEVNNLVFDSEFKKLRKEISKSELNETANSLSKTFNSEEFKVTTYSYSTENEEELPVKLILSQTNSKKANFQTKLSLKMLEDKKIKKNKDMLKELL